MTRNHAVEGRYRMHTRPPKPILFAAALALWAGCVVLPRSAGPSDAATRSKTFAHGRIEVINALEPVLTKQSFSIKAKDPASGFLLAGKSGRIDSDYGYYRIQQYCLFWGYASFATIELSAHASETSPRSTSLTISINPAAAGTGKILDKTMEDLELRLFLQDGKRRDQD